MIRVIVPERAIEKTKKNLEAIANVEIVAMDLMSPKSIDAFKKQFGLAPSRLIGMV